jgi:hypothetical protein
MMSIDDTFGIMAPLDEDLFDDTGCKISTTCSDSQLQYPHLDLAGTLLLEKLQLNFDFLQVMQARPFCPLHGISFALHREHGLELPEETGKSSSGISFGYARA